MLVDVKAHDALLERLVARARGLVLGPGVEDPDMGPLISSDQRGIAQRYISIAREDGAQVVTGGAPPKDERLAHGSFLEPTIIDGVDPASQVAQDEIFGPVLAVITFSTIEEAAALADQSRYGLVAGVWTKNIDTAMRLATSIKAGQIFVNAYGAGGGVEIPFGGYKRSGYGREKGLEALNSYTQVKNICIRYA